VLSSSAILPEFVGYRFEIHNGKKFFPIEVKANMVRTRPHARRASTSRDMSCGECAFDGLTWNVCVLCASSFVQIGKKFGEFAPTRQYPKHPDAPTPGVAPPTKK
jgi:ribosomal protein S19